MASDDFSPDELETHRALLALDQTPGPGNGFVAGLRADLLRGHPGSSHQQIAQIDYPGDRPRGRIGRELVRRGRWPQYMDAVAAALVLVLVAALAAAIGRSDETPRGAQVGTPVPNGGVGMLFGDAARTGAAPGPLPDGVPELVWEAAASETDYDGVSPPVVVDGVVYAVRQRVVPPLEGPGTVQALVALPSTVLALDLATGGILWETTIPEQIQSPAVAVAGGTVFVTTSQTERALIALDAATGDERWAYDASGVGDPRRLFIGGGPSGPERGAPAFVDGVVYFGSQEGALHAVDAATGARRWAVTIPSAGAALSPTSPAVAEGIVYVASNQGVLFAFDAVTGAERWRAEIGGNWATTPVVAGGAVFVGASLVETPNARPVHTDDGVAVMPTPITSASEPGSRLLVLRADTGVRRWVHEVDGTIMTAPTVFGRVVTLVAVGPNGSEVTALGVAAGGWKWTVGLAGQVPAPAVVDGTFVFTAYSANDVANTGELLTFDAATGPFDAVTGQGQWYVVMPSAPTGPPTVADGLVVVPTQDGLAAFGAVPNAEPVPTDMAVPMGTLSASPEASASATCPVTPYSTTGPDPEFSYLWYGARDLVAGVYPDSVGVWYADPEGPKVHWFRPPGASLTVEGRRLDGDAPPLTIRLPEGYATQPFQVSRLIFPDAGCWEVVGRTEGAELRFVVDVRPGDQYRAATPVPATVWDTLMRRLEGPSPSTTGRCSVSPVGTSDRVVGAVLGDGLVRIQGLGDGTVGLERESGGVPSGLQIYLVVDPRAAGPLLVRPFALDENGAIGFGPGRWQSEFLYEGRGDAVPPDWLIIHAVVEVTGAGCYALQIDGPSVSEVVVFEAVDVAATPVASPAG